MVNSLEFFIREKKKKRKTTSGPLSMSDHWAASKAINSQWGASEFIKIKNCIASEDLWEGSDFEKSNS